MQAIKILQGSAIMAAFARVNGFSQVRVLKMLSKLDGV